MSAGIFSSPEPKAQVSFSDYSLSVVCRHPSHLYHHKLFIFSSPLENLAQSMPG